jgi:hypothetical protein
MFSSLLTMIRRWPLAYHLELQLPDKWMLLVANDPLQFRQLTALGNFGWRPVRVGGVLPRTVAKRLFASNEIVVCFPVSDDAP